MPENKKPTFAQEFKTFIARGNVVDLAVGIIIGSAFTSIVNSIVKDVIMPPIGIIMGRVNFSDLKLVLQTKTNTLPEVAILYGNLIQNTLNFLIVAFVVFTIVKAINAMKKKEEKKVEEKKESELSVLMDIRTLLKKKAK